MLDVTDPLWKKLDAAFRDQDIPRLLAELRASWNQEKASSLFWDTLCHQGTCHGSTYASVPHLLNMAQARAAQRQRLEIALFLGHVTLCALEDPQCPPLPGLPKTLQGWDRKLESYRTLVAMLENPLRATSDYERNKLPHYKEVLAIEPVNEADLEKIRQVRSEFLSAVPSIGSLCEQAFLEHASDNDAVVYLLSGVAAAVGLLDVARLLNSGAEGLLKCAACHWPYEYVRFGDSVAIYAEPEQSPTPGSRKAPDRSLADYRDQAPSRCDGFIVPAKKTEVLDNRAMKLWSLSERAVSPNASLLVANFLGRISCCKCGEESPVEGA